MSWHTDAIYRSHANELSMERISFFVVLPSWKLDEQKPPKPTHCPRRRIIEMRRLFRQKWPLGDTEQHAPGVATRGGALASLDSGGASLRVLTLVTFLCVCVSSVAPVSINIFIVRSFPGFFYLKKKCGSDASISEPARSNLNKINSNFQHISRSFSFEFFWVNRPTFWERCKQPVTKKKLKCIGSRKNVHAAWESGGF